MSSGDSLSRQQKDANGYVTQNVFLVGGSRHVNIDTAIAHPCTAIDLGVRFVEITGTTPFHYLVGTNKALMSGAIMTLDNAYCPANTPKIIAIGDANLVGVRAAANQIPGQLHITLLK